MAQDMKRIVITGLTATDVQGITLREKVERLAKQLGAKGFVRNVKGKSEVEVICDADKAKELFEGIGRIRERLGGMFAIGEPTETLFDEFTDFTIKREDDLTEMVWGLQGAGKAFLSAEDVREEMRKKRLMRGLKGEISSISDRIEDVKSGVGTFRTICMENFLKEPPLGPDISELLDNLNDLWDACDEANRLMPHFSQSDARARIEDNIKRIESLVGAINKKLGDEDGI